MDTPLDTAASKGTVWFVVTGFSQFEGVEDNPTEVLVKGLKVDSLAAEGICLHDRAVLPVTGKDVREWMRRWFTPGQLAGPPLPSDAPAVVGGTSRPSLPQACKHLVFIHLGVATSHTCFHLERTSYNNAHFRCPDEAGWQPDNDQIDVCKDLEHPRHTDLNLEHIAAMLRQGPGGFDVQLSSDPGRYVCNYIYYYSLCCCSGEAEPTARDEAPLHAAGELNARGAAVLGDVVNSEGLQAISKHVAEVSPHGTVDDASHVRVGTAAAKDAPGVSITDDSNVKRHSVFVHVPPFSTIAVDVQTRFLVALLLTLHESLSS